MLMIKQLETYFKVSCLNLLYLSLLSLNKMLMSAKTQ